MALTGWVASHTGMPCVTPSETGPVWAGRRLLAVVGESRVGVPVCDPLAPVGRETVYRQGASEIRLARASRGSHMVTDRTGHVMVPVRWLGSDDTDMGVSVVSQRTSRGVADRWPLVGAPSSFSMECVTSGAATEALRALVSGAGRLVVVHDETVCDVDGCDIEPVRVVVVSKATHQRTAHRPAVRRSWSLSCEVRDGLEDATGPMFQGARGYASGVVTWGEWDAIDRGWAHRTYLDLCRLIAGMP